MKSYTTKKQFILISLFPTSILISTFLGSKPYFVEKYYSRFFFINISRLFNKPFSLFPVSIAEMILLLISLAFIVYTYIMLKNILISKYDRLKIFKIYILNLLSAVSLFYFFFEILWGFNYQRLTLSETLKLKYQSSSSHELINLCNALVSQTNNYREKVINDSNGLMKLPYTKNALYKKALIGYNNLPGNYSFLHTSFISTKGIFLSELMCYAGITGFYFPFTFEANINVKTPTSFLPSTVTHEMAHQIGYAREDEANFIAYITCMSNPDINFKYSGSLLALTYAMDTLYNTNTLQYKKLFKLLNPGVKKDLKYSQDFWQKYNGPFEQLSEKTNDLYLKSQNQSSGIYSYNEMVNLLLAYFTTNHRTQPSSSFSTNN